jgi:hypothetical protein
LKKAILALLFLLILGLGIWIGQRLGGKSDLGAATGLDPNDPALKATLPQADPLVGLPASALDALLKPELTPQQQTEIIGHLLLDYWSTHRSLPNGTWEEICAQLSGQNKAQLTHVPVGHPALGKSAFQASKENPGIRYHVISSSGAAFQLIYDGPDGKPYTDDDLIRNFPADLEF